MNDIKPHIQKALQTPSAYTQRNYIDKKSKEKLKNLKVVRGKNIYYLEWSSNENYSWLLNRSHETRRKFNLIFKDWKKITGNLNFYTSQKKKKQKAK